MLQHSTVLHRFSVRNTLVSSNTREFHHRNQDRRGSVQYFVGQRGCPHALGIGIADWSSTIWSLASA